VQLGHPVGGRALLPDHDDHVAVELAPREGLQEAHLVAEHARRRLDEPVLRRDGRHLDHRAAQ
jgi:hypothetical protein